MDEHEARQLAKSPGLVLKFASLQADGELASDAHDNYDGLFDDLPSEWSSTPFTVEPRGQAWPHDAWGFTYKGKDARILAVHHETGLELVLTVLVAPLAVDALKALAIWTWRRWNARRAPRPEKVQSSIVLEKTIVHETFPDGRVRKEETVRYVLAPPVDEAELAALIERAKS